MEILILIVLLGIVAAMLRHDEREYGAGCAGALALIFVATVILGIVGSLAAKGVLP